MKKLKILIYEDDITWKESMEYNLTPKFGHNGWKLHLIHREDDSTLMEDLERLPDLIMIDFDLVDITGEQIIEAIDNDPDYRSVKIFFYSGGESIDSLKKIAKKFGCSIRCFTKEGDELEEAILSLV
ncbi:MAG: hypothetical protein IT258_22105 [Saprospiraceae bacterium]|nr:hypothetical protein [Saprospiraceae bacterium]